MVQQNVGDTARAAQYMNSSHSTLHGGSPSTTAARLLAKKETINRFPCEREVSVILYVLIKPEHQDPYIAVKVVYKS
jgi:hypothetical protein